MRHFLLKIFLFSSPVFLLALFTREFYSDNIGDLVRVGYIIDLFPDYDDVFYGASDGEIQCEKILNSPTRTNFTALTIGDSFSDFDSVGYNRYLADNSDIKVLHFNQILTKNPIENLYTLLNGDFFDKRKFEFVILECVERNIISNVGNLITNKTTSNVEIDSLVQIRNKKINGGQGERSWNVNFKFDFYSNRIIKFPYNTAKYYLTNTCLFDKAISKTKLSSQLFSVQNRNLLFLYEDVGAVEKNNIVENVDKLNVVLNDLNDRLKRRGIKLIVLPAPDKYDLYYEYIVDKRGFNKPLFFDHFNRTKKDYIYINSKKILSAAVSRIKDVYLYDDSHWSPWAAKLIAKEIETQIDVNRK